VRRSCLEMQIPHSFVQQYSISFLAEIRNVIILARHTMKTNIGAITSALVVVLSSLAPLLAQVHAGSGSDSL